MKAQRLVLLAVGLIWLLSGCSPSQPTTIPVPTATAAPTAQRPLRLRSELALSATKG